MGSNSNGTTSGRLGGKRILITGAGGGIGSEAMRCLKEEGAHVLGIDLTAGYDILEADIRDVEAVKKAIGEAIQRLGGIDILINNAGIGRGQDAGDFPDEQARLIMDVNFFGTWNMTAATMPALLKNHGHVINVASGLALANVGYSAAYSASKRAIAAYSDVLRQEYGDRIYVTTLYPAFIRTPIHDTSAKDNTSLADIVREEPVEFASKALLKAILTKPRDLSTSHVSNFQLFLARHFRRSLDNMLRDKMKKVEKVKGKPTFVRDFDRS